MLFGEELFKKQILTKLWYLEAGFQVIFLSNHPGISSLAIISRKCLRWLTGRKYLTIIMVTEEKCTLSWLNRQKK